MTYLEELAKQTKEPIYYIEVWNREQTQVLQRYGSRTILGFEVMAQGLLPPKANLQKINESEGTITVGTMSFEILNLEFHYPNKSITELASAYSLIGSYIKLYGGFHTLHYTDYVQLYKGEIVSVKVNRDATGMILGVHDLTGLLSRTLMTDNKDNTVLTVTMNNNTNGTATVDSTGGWPSSGHFRVDEEIIKYYSTTATTLVLYEDNTNITGRGAYNTLRNVSHLADTPVWRVEVYELNPIDMVLNLLTTTENGGNGAYDLGKAKFGLGVSQDDIDFDSFEWVRDSVLNPPDSIRLLIDAEEVITQSFKAQQAINEWILHPIGCYMAVTWDGKIALRVISSTQFQQGATPFVDRNLTGKLSYDRKEQNIYNNTTYIFDHNPGTGEMLTLSGIHMKGALEVYGDNTPLATYDTRAYHSDFDAGRLFYFHLRRRYEHGINPIASIKGKSTFSQLDVGLGEVVTLNTTHLPAVQTAGGGWGISGDVQVVNRQPNYSKGTIDWSFLFLDDVKQLTRSEQFLTRTPDDGTVTYAVNNSPQVETQDGYYDCGPDDSANFAMLRFYFSHSADPTEREFWINLTLWLLSYTDETYLKYDFTLRYTADGAIKNFMRWFLVPWGIYKYKVDYWQKNDLGVGTPYTPDDITWDLLRLYQLDYTLD